MPKFRVYIPVELPKIVDAENKEDAIEKFNELRDTEMGVATAEELEPVAEEL